MDLGSDISARELYVRVSFSIVFKQPDGETSACFTVRSSASKSNNRGSLAGLRAAMLINSRWLLTFGIDNIPR